MTKKYLEEAVSLFTAIKHLKGHDCSNFIKHLNDKGIEIICRIIHYVLNGELVFSRKTRKSLRKKISKYLTEFHKLTYCTKNSLQIRKKRQVLQRGGIVGVLTAIASAVIPTIISLLTQ